MERFRKRVQEEIAVPVHKIFRKEMTENHNSVAETSSYENS